MKKDGKKEMSKGNKKVPETTDVQIDKKNKCIYYHKKK